MFECEKQPYLIPRILLIGKKGVGKSTFMKSLYPSGLGIFDCNTELTIGVGLYTYDYNFKSSEVDDFIRYQIWVFNPEGRFRGVSHNYYYGSNVIFIMFDISNLTSLDAIDNWMKVIKEQCRNNLIILLGNKADLTEYLKSSKALADSLVRKYQLMGYYEISALKSWNIRPIFDALAQHFQLRYPPNKK